MAKPLQQDWIVVGAILNRHMLKVYLLPSFAFRHVRQRLRCHNTYQAHNLQSSNVAHLLYARQWINAQSIYCTRFIHHSLIRGELHNTHV